MDLLNFNSGMLMFYFLSSFSPFQIFLEVFLLKENPIIHYEPFLSYSNKITIHVMEKLKNYLGLFLQNLYYNKDSSWW
jgi:hypothetical protein